ncbi:ribosomal protein S18-domain-containing protein, partial [Cladochytrium replicatum]
QTYHPKDLNDENLQPYLAKRKEAARSLGLAQSANGTHNTDLFKEMGWDALKMYKRPEVLSHFVTEMGYIKPRRDTGLTQQNQRRLSKAIKRAQHFGM